MAGVSARNSDNVRIFGDLRDMVWAAPVGTPLPTTLEEDPGGLWAPFGWLSEDGITYSPTTNVEKFKAHQGGATVRTKVTSTEKTLSFTALETNPLTRRVFDGAGEPVLTEAGSNTVRLDLPESIGVTEFALLVQSYDESPTGLVTEFMCIERWAVGERGEAAISNADIRGFEFTGDILGNSYILTDAAAFVEKAAVSG